LYQHSTKGINEATMSSYSDHQHTPDRRSKQSQYTKAIGTNSNITHDTRTRKPYLGIERLDIHEFDGESLPSDNEQVPESSDEEPAAPRPQSEDSSDNDKPTQHYTPATEQRPASPAASDTSYTYYRGRPRELLHPNEHHYF
jgi:hypothetical protein